MHEILTLQLGHRANYLATHFWNTQESYFDYDANSPPSTIDHDVHFRAGQGPSGEDTYTPRTLIYDFKREFGGLRKWGGLYNQGDVEGDMKNLWDGSLVRRQDAPITQSEYQRALDKGLETLPKLNTQTVRFWSDFTRVFYHPRSIVQINDYELGSTSLPFEKWGSGEDLFSTLDKDHDLLDRDVRPWAEECDQMQGMQIFGSADDAWGGFASKYVESLKDEYGKIPLWFWALEGDGTETRRVPRTVNIAQSLQGISALTSMYIPLAVPSFLPSYIQLDRTSYWQASGLLSMAVESMTLPTRQRPDRVKRGLLSDLETALNANGNRRIAELQSSVVEESTQRRNGDTGPNVAGDCRLPDSDEQEVVYEDEVEKANSKLDMSFSTSQSSPTALSLRQWEKANHVFAKVEAVRGLPLTAQEAEEEEEASSRKRRRLASLPTVEKHVHGISLHYFCLLTLVSRFHSPSPYPFLDSFPEIVSRSHLTAKGAAIHGSLSTTSQISKRVKALQNVLSRTVDVADREGLSNGLGEIAEAYEEGWDSGSDVDSD
ncbi:MAG: hypothetical protein Q9181_005116 [Wetmoreana brouardii]